MDVVDRSKDAKHTLRKIKEAIDEGAKMKALQLQPHLVLLDRQFYDDELKPLLADWQTLFLAAPDQGWPREGVAYLLPRRSPRRQRPARGQRRWRRASTAHSTSSATTPEDALALAELQSIVPFALAKVNRVSYGLLSAEQIADAKESGTLPLNRELLVVTVGKDTPSRASEFSHPDVVITLTTCVPVRRPPPRRLDEQRMGAECGQYPSGRRAASGPLGRGEARPRHADDGGARGGVSPPLGLELARRRFVAPFSSDEDDDEEEVWPHRSSARRRRADRGAVRAARPARWPEALFMSSNFERTMSSSR